MGIDGVLSRQAAGRDGVDAGAMKRDVDGNVDAR
jgi:hypothetical protein